MDKAYLRNTLRRMCRELTPAQRAAAAEGVYEVFRGNRLLAKAHTIGAYVGVRGEISLKPLMSHSSARWAFPKTDPDSRDMSWHHSTAWPTQRGAFGIPEPSTDAPLVDPSDVDLWLIPAVATDRTGARLGQGGGYYDTLLAGVRAPVVAVVHAFQHRYELPMEPHDQYVDYVLTPKRTYAYGVRERMLRG